MTTFDSQDRKYRSAVQTILMDVQLTQVADRFRSTVARQTAPAKVDAGYRLSTVTMMVDPKGVQLPATNKIIYIETAYPISMLIGSAVIGIGTEQGGVYAHIGAHPAYVLTSDIETPVNITYY